MNRMLMSQALRQTLVQDIAATPVEDSYEYYELNVTERSTRTMWKS